MILVEFVVIYGALIDLGMFFCARLFVSQEKLPLEFRNVTVAYLHVG